MYDWGTCWPTNLHLEHFMLFRSLSRTAPSARALVAITLLAPTTHAAKAPAPLTAHEDFNLADFAGSYYEVARLASFPSLMCADATANFTAAPNQSNTLLASFTCTDFGLVTTLAGLLSPIDERFPGHMTFEYDEVVTRHSDFSVLIAAQDYSWFLVGEPSRKSAYIYSATPDIDPSVLRDLIIRLNTTFDYVSPERFMHCTQQNGAVMPGCDEVLPD